MGWFGRRDGAADRERATTDPLPEAVRQALPLDRGERLLATTPTRSPADPRVWLVATTWRLAAATDDGHLGWARPWHEVDAAAWSREAAELTVSFVDGRRPLVFPLDQVATFLSVLRERVQASVVSAEQVPVPGARKARAVLRHDLRTGQIVEQLVLGRGGQVTEAMQEAALPAFRRLREEVGMSPHGPRPTGPDLDGTATGDVASG